MNTVYQLAAWIAVALSVSGTVAFAQDAQPQPMLNDGYFDRARAADAASVSLMSVDKATFKAAYDKAGRPKLVVLIGQPFSDMVSDWYSTRRINLNSQATGTAGTFTPESQSVQVASEVRVSGTTNRSTLLTAAQWDEYQRGFQRVLMEHGVRIVNRAVALRLLDSEVRESSKQVMQSDNLRLEMDMLRKHTNLLLEVVPYQENKLNYEPIGYQVTMTSLEDATILADDRVAIPLARMEYRAGEGGYQLQRPRKVVGVAATAGGYEIIEEELELWAEQGELAAQATLQLLYDRYL